MSQSRQLVSIQVLLSFQLVFVPWSDHILADQKWRSWSPSIYLTQTRVLSSDSRNGDIRLSLLEVSSGSSIFFSSLQCLCTKVPMETSALLQMFVHPAL